MASWSHAYNNICKIGATNCRILIIKGLQDAMAPQADNLHQASNAVMSSYNGDHDDLHLLFNNGDIGDFLNTLS